MGTQLDIERMKACTRACHKAGITDPETAIPKLIKALREVLNDCGRLPRAGGSIGGEVRGVTITAVEAALALVKGK